MEKVSVNKGVLIGAAAVAAASLIAVAFLLGRASGPGAPAARVPGGALPDPAAGSAPSAPLVREPAADQAANSAAPVPDPAESRPGLPPASPGMPAPAAANGPAETADPARTAVASYLDTVEHLQPGRASDSPESLGNEMAAALAKGDTSGLDRTIRDTEAARQKLAAVVPPFNCSAHYRESLGSLDDALSMLRSLKAAVESPEPAARLAAVGTQAGALRTRAESLQREEAALRQRYGLAR